MLEWQTASHVEASTAHDRRSVWRRMWPSVLVGATLMAAGAWRADVQPLARGFAWWSAAVAWTALTLVWLLVPEMALALSAPVRRRSLTLDGDERAAALRYALYHWR